MTDYDKLTILVIERNLRRQLRKSDAEQYYNSIVLNMTDEELDKEIEKITK